MPFPRRALVLLATAVAVLAGGCTAVTDPSATQDGIGAPLVVSTTLCASDGDGNNYPSRCLNEPITDAVGKQLLVAYAVPAGATFESAELTGAPAGTKLEPNASFSTWMTGYAAPPAGMRWAGFASNRLATAPAGSVKVTVSFAMPGASNAAPAGTAPVKVATWARAVADDAAAATPVACGCSLVHRFGGGWPESVVALRDVAVTGLDLPIAVDPGSEVTLPFTLAYGGDAASGTLVPSAETSIPGATVSGLDSASFASTGTKALPLKLTIPAKPTVGGPQTLKLTIKLPSGGTRSATVKLRLPELPKPDPVVEQPKPVEQTPPPVDVPPVTQPRGENEPPVVVPPLSLAAGRVSGAKVKRGLTLKQAFPAAGRATIEVRLGAKRLARRTTTVAAAGTKTLRLTWTAAGRKALRGRTTARVKLLVTFTDATGRKATRTVLATVR